MVTQHTIEENIIKKANQKKYLNQVVITEGGFTTDFFKKLNVIDLFESEDVSSKR